MSRQAFILPLPKSASSLEPKEEEGINSEKELLLLQEKLDKLRKGRIKWEDFLQTVDLSSPALRAAATSKEGDTILHLAALHGRRDIFEQLGNDVSFRWRRNLHGMTPIEIAQFLHKKELFPHSQDRFSFCDQPGVRTEEKFRLMLSEIEYLSHPIFEGSTGLYKILSRSQKAKKIDQIPPEKIWMGIYFDKEIQQGLHPPVSIRFVDEEVGFGLFAEARIPSCAFVGEYTGIVSERKKRHLDGKTYCVRYTVWEMGRKNFVIDAEEKGNFTRFINHSAKPNLSLQSVYWRGLPRMIFVALKEIPEGAQLTFDYGTFFWKECHQTPKNLTS